MKTDTTRFRPEMLDIARKGVKLAIYAVVGMIITFTILSAAGLGDVGQTIIIVLSMIVGLVVSMAATGSIGNILSGIVIMSFKPFEEGDWVVVGDKYRGRIVETNLIFTKMRDLENELIEIPNNIVLSQGIINWSSASKAGGYAVEIDTTIGYDAPSRQVIKLMCESANRVDAVKRSPEPFVVLTEFQNHAIGYKLRAYIDDPEKQFTVRSDIMVMMHRVFTENGVEILSPVYEIGRIQYPPSQDEIKERAKIMKGFE
jgi:small-conductance mechanosensitive channel